MTRLFTALALWSAAVAGFASNTPAPAPASSPLPVQDFFRSGLYEDALLNPTGDLVLAATHPDIDTHRVTVIDLRSQTSTDVASGSLPGTTYRYLGWATGDMAEFTQHLADDSTQFVLLHWGGVRNGVPSFKATLSDVGNFSVVDRTMYDGRHLLVKRLEGSGSDAYYGIYRVDPIGGPGQMTSAARIAKLDRHTIFILTDSIGNLQLIVTKDDDGVRHFMTYAGKDQDGTTHWHEFLQLKDETSEFEPIAFTSDDHAIYALSNLGQSTVGLVEYDPVADKLLRTVFSSDEGDVTYARYDPYSDGIIYLTWTTGVSLHYEVLDKRAAAYMPKLLEAFPGKRVIPWSVSRDGHATLVYVYSDTDPGEYYVFDAATRQVEPLGEAYPWFDGYAMAPVHQGSIKTQDGFSISYLLTLPARSHGPFPLVVIPHGGPIGIFDADTFDPEAQLLASRGYAVLKVNYRGSGGSGQKFLDAGKQQWGRKIEDDIDETVRAVLGTQPIDRDRVCIYGASYGGYSALMSMIRFPALYKCAASFAGVMDIPLMYDSSTIQYSTENRRAMADIIGDPTTDAAKLRAVSPVYLASEITRPVFIAQGGADGRVDPEQAYRMKLVLERLGKPLEFHYYPHDGHGFRELADETDFYTRLLQFFDKNIGPEAGRVAVKSKPR